MGMKSTGRGNKGVSEVIGYLLMFAIVVTIVSVIYVSGMPVVDQTKESSALTSMETVFLTLQGNIKKVAVGQSPVRTMKLNVVKGSIMAHSADEDLGNITITIENATGTYSTGPIRFGNIEYRLGTQKLVYENGAVIEHSPGGNIIVSEPLIFFTNYSGADIFISVINVSGNFSMSGALGQIQMGPYNVTRDTCVYHSAASANNVNITIKTSYAHAWSLFLNNSYNEAFGQPPTDAGRSEGSCWLKITKGTGGVAENLNLTLISHNVTVS